MPKRAAPKKSSDGSMDVDRPATQSSEAAVSTKGSKRRTRDNDNDEDEDSDAGNGTDTEMLDVSFSFFDPQPQDYHSLKLLLSQLLQGDAAELDLGGVADLILEQKLVGTTVKTDGGEDDDKAAEGDPYAVLTVLNLNVHKEHKALSALTSYLLSKLPTGSPFHTELTTLLAHPADASTAAAPKHVGLVLSERLVNMPAQIVPPMYRMLEEELQWARDENEPYHFSHLVFLSRVFRSSASALDSDPNAALEAALVAEASARAALLGGPKRKKGRKGTAPSEAGNEAEDKLWLYHAEDEAVEKVSTHKQVFEYTRGRRVEDGPEAFGVEVKGQLMLVPYARWGALLEGMERVVSAVV